MIDVSSHKGSFLFIYQIGGVDSGCQAVLKTVGCKSFAGSNPVSSADKVFGVKFLGTPDSKSKRRSHSSLG